MKRAISEHIRQQVAALPHSPGVYQFVDSQGKIIYVGKAKSLKRRVSSYFVDRDDHTAKVLVMTRQVVDIRHIVVDSEQDALLLENSLIKTLQPRYNILLKDDKSYPWIVIRREPFPRVQSTRELIRDGSKYYGPYGTISTQRAILEFIREVIPLRTCNHDLSPRAIASGRHTVCLQYHLGNCKGPCVGAQDEASYAESIALVQSILKGDLRPVREWLTKEMWRAAEELRFEQAEQYKQRLAALDKYQARSVIVSSRIVDCDVFTLLADEDDDVAYCNYLRISHGSITAVQTLRISRGIETSPEALLTAAIQHLVESLDLKLSREVIVPYLPSSALLFDGVTFTVPKRGEKAKLVEFSERCARLYRAELMRNMEIKNPERHTDRLMSAMQRELRLDREPRHIECFDNSNLQGTNAVSACVVFRNGKPSRRDYRHYNVQSVEGPNDYATIQEVIRRRYTRLLNEELPLPDLIIVDGGKGQLSSAIEVLRELGLYGRIPIIGLAERYEEVYYPNDPMPYYLSRTGEPLKVICHIRDEAHRFGITHHRNKRSKALTTSELDNIKGIGEKSRTALLRHFRSTKAIRTATEAMLSDAIGPAKAKLVYDYFNREKDS